MLFEFTAVDSSTVATGIGGIVGNKGAVAISLYLGSMSFLFVNAHLTGIHSGILSYRICTFSSLS